MLAAVPDSDCVGPHLLGLRETVRAVLLHDLGGFCLARPGWSPVQSCPESWPHLQGWGSVRATPGATPGPSPLPSTPSSVNTPSSAQTSSLPMLSQGTEGPPPCRAQPVLLTSAARVMLPKRAQALPAQEVPEDGGKGAPPTWVDSTRTSRLVSPPRVLLISVRSVRVYVWLLRVKVRVRRSWADTIWNQFPVGQVEPRRREGVRS